MEAVRYSDIKENAQLAELYSNIYGIPRVERIKVLMSWLANAYSDLLIPFLPEEETLATFRVHVRLLDTFANNSSYDVVAQLASEFSENFLVSQVIPNLLERSDRTADITYYVQVICEHLTCASLVRKLMDVVASQLTPILISRMLYEDHMVVSATLSLIKVLLEFYCEDLWYDLILQYLLPMKHLLTSQRQKMLPDIEFYESTHKLLELIPKCVTNTISTSLIADHYLLYFQDEIARLRKIDSAVASALPSSKSDLHRVGLDHDIIEVSGDEVNTAPRKAGRNSTYPMWIFKYDGTDFLNAIRRGFIQEPEEFFEDDLFSPANQLNASSELFGNGDKTATTTDFSSSQLSDDEDSFVLASVSVGANSLSKTSEETRFEGMMKSIVKDKRSSIDNLDDTNNSGLYFGPFLNALYELLKRWTELDPDVLFTATEVISILAASRIPLINTLFLDMSLTLQPSYPSFSTLLNSVKTELEGYMLKYPDYILRNAWKSAGKDCSLTEYELESKQDTASAARDESFVDAMKRRIVANRSFRIAAEEVQRIGSSRSSSFRTFTNMFKTQRTNSGRSSEFRLLNRTATPFESEDEERYAKVMALRCVLFSHWMLELGAVAMQLCWGKALFHGNQQDNTGDNNNSDSLVPNGATTAV